MRKKTVSNFFDNVFWYILYLLPVLFYMVWLFIPKENIEPAPNDKTLYEYHLTQNQGIVFYEDETNPLYNPDENWDLGNFNPYYILLAPENFDFNLGDLMQGGLYIPAFGFWSVYMNPFIIDGAFTPDSLQNIFGPVGVNLWCFGSSGVTIDGLSYSSFNPLVTTTLFSSTILDNSFSFYSLYVVSMLDGELLNTRYFGSCDTDVLLESFDVSPVTNTLYANSPYNFNTFMNDIGFGFATDNIVVNSLEEIFGANGVMPIFSTNTPFIIFAWFICVFLIHLVVDFLLFLPRLAHKWMNEFGGD